AEGKDKFTFRELCLVLGRRGSKTILASVITAYEIYKLLVIGGGDPHKFYGLPYDDEIAIINVALSQEQSGRLFGQVQARIRNSPFFKGRISKETTKEIRFYTDKDLEKKNRLKLLSGSDRYSTLLQKVIISTISGLFFLETVSLVRLISFIASSNGF
ncbi:unnamed protein product, partial [marine sediment metagenome]